MKESDSLFRHSLFQEGAPRERIGEYWRRFVRWLRSGVEVMDLVVTCKGAETKKDRTLHEAKSGPL